MTPEEIYAKHHKTATRPNPFLPNDTLRAMEEYAEQQSQKAIEDTKAEYGLDTTGFIDEMKDIREDIKTATHYLGVLLDGSSYLSYFTDRQAASNFFLLLSEKYLGIKSRKITKGELQALKGKKR
jgi:phage terminase large subunit